MLNLIFLGLGLDALTIRLSNFLLMLESPIPEDFDIDGGITAVRIPIPKPLPEASADGCPSISCNPPKVLPNKNEPYPQPVILLLDTAFPLIVLG